MSDPTSPSLHRCSGPIRLLATVFLALAVSACGGDQSGTTVGQPAGAQEQSQQPVQQAAASVAAGTAGAHYPLIGSSNAAAEKHAALRCARQARVHRTDAQAAREATRRKELISRACETASQSASAE